MLEGNLKNRRRMIVFTVISEYTPSYRHCFFFLVDIYVHYFCWNIDIRKRHCQASIASLRPLFSTCEQQSTTLHCDSRRCRTPEVKSGLLTRTQRAPWTRRWRWTVHKANCQSPHIITTIYCTRKPNVVFAVQRKILLLRDAESTSVGINCNCTQRWNEDIPGRTGP